MADIKSNQEIVITEGAVASFTGSDMLSDGYRGIVVYVTVNSATTDDVTVTVQRKSPTSPTDYEDLGATAAISTTGLTTLTIYPGIAETANTSISDVLGAVFRINGAVDGGGSIDYDVAIALIP